MNLSDLLEELRFNILNDRTTRVSGSSDYLWTDATLVRYIDEAQRRFAVQGLVIRDSTTTEVTDIALVAGQIVYPVHESVIAVLSARRSTDDADLRRVGHAILGAYRPPSETWVDPSNYNSLPPGPPLAYSTDESMAEDDGGSMGAVNLRVYPTPSAAEAGSIIKMRVVRKPLERFVETNLGAVPEIPEEHHLEMLDWAAYLALRIVDDDAGSPKRATDFRASFEDHVRRARTTAVRKLFAPIPWGFGRNGFSWEH
jgi:hypothetical protein